MTLAFVPLFVRYLGIEAFGLIGLFAMVQGWLVLLDLGMAPAISRETALALPGEQSAKALRDLLRSTEYVAAAIMVLLAILSWSISRWLAAHWLSTGALPTETTAHALALMGVVIGLRILENIYRNVLIGMQRQVALNVLLAMMATLRGPGAIAALLLIAPTLDIYFEWQCLVSVLAVIAFSVSAYSRLPRAERPGSFSVQAISLVWRFAAGALAITLLSLLLTSIDKILLSRLLPLSMFGYYMFALTVAQAPLGLVAPLVQAFYPRFVQLHNAREESRLADSYHTAAQGVTVLLGSATVLLVVFGREILILWARDNTLVEQSLSLIRVLSVGTLFNGVMTLPYYLQLASGWTGLMIRINFLALALVVSALVILVPIAGASAAAWIWLVLNLSYFAVVADLMHRRLLSNEKWRWYLGDTLAPLASASIVAVLLSQLPRFVERAPLAAEICLFGILIVGAAALSSSAFRQYVVRFDHASNVSG